MASGSPPSHNYVYKDDGYGRTQVRCRCGQWSPQLTWDEAVAWANRHTAHNNPEWSRQGALASVVVVFDFHEGEREAQVRRLPNDLAGAERTRVPGEAREDSPLWGVCEEGESKPTVKELS